MAYSFLRMRLQTRQTESAASTESMAIKAWEKMCIRDRVKAMKEETTITFLASECGEFHGMGECIECTSLKEAFWHYQRFCKRSPQMVPSLEFSLHHADDPLYNEGEYPLATGERGRELLSCVPYYANHPLVQEAVRELEKLEEQQKRQKKQSRER